MAYKDLDKKRAQDAAWRRANPDKAKAIAKKYRETHRAEVSRRTADWNKRNQAIVTKRAYACHFKKQFGITLEDKARILAGQGGKCPTCGSNEESKIGPWCLDHNHETGKIRGVLCRRCNMVLGSVGDNSEVLQLMVNYLIEDREV